MFNFGVDDLRASMEFLQTLKLLNRMPGLEVVESERILRRGTLNLKQEDYYSYNIGAAETVKLVWAETEEGFLPKIRKY